MTGLSLTKPIVFIDVETTGLNTQQDRIVDICAIKIHPDGREESLSSLINPTIPIPIEATGIHGITNSDVSEKPTFKEFSSMLFNFMQDCDIGGFGVAKFDLSVLEAEFKRANITYSRQGKQILDVQRIYHKLEPRDLNAAHIRYCNKILEGAHRAQIDVRATVDVLESQLKLYGNLPHDVVGLHEFCNPKDPTWVDEDGKFAWSGNDVIFNFGKHIGETLQHVYKNSSDYLDWIVKRDDFSSEVKTIAANAINGIFPQPLNNVLTSLKK